MNLYPGLTTKPQFGYSVACAGDINGDGFSDVIVGAPVYDAGAYTDKGLASVYYGNTCAEAAGVGRAVKPRQRKTDDTLLGPEGMSDKCVQARMALFARTPFGRAKATMEVEVKPVGVLFDGTSLRRGSSWVDTLVTGADVFKTVNGLTKSTPYHWRARLVYQAASAPFQSRSRWLSPAWNAVTENDFRTPTPPKAPGNPGATAIANDSITWTWQDNSSDETGFKVWEGPGSADPLVQDALTAANVTSHVYSGLQTNAQYGFQVAATASVGDSDKTTTFTAWTTAAVPTAPVVSGATGTTLDVQIGAGDGNPSYTVYAINVSPGVGGNVWVQTDGTLGAAPFCRTATDWGTITVTGLAGNSTYNFTVIARNGAGVDTAASPATAGVTLDAVPPTGTISINSGAAYTTSAAVTLNLTGDDAGGSGVADMRFSEDNSSWGAWVPFATAYSFSLTGSDGPKSVYVQFRDVVGNVSVGDITASILLETSIPTGTITINGGASCTGLAAVTLTLSSDDGSGSGVGEMQFSEDGLSWSAWEGVAASRVFTLSGVDGSKTVYVQYRDLAGNVSAAVSAGITLDTTGPAGTVTVNGGAPFTSTAAVSLAVTADDGIGCGAAQMRFSEDGLSWSAWEAFAAVKSFTLTGADGAKAIYVQFQDVVGNVSASPALGGIALDTTGPLGTVTVDGGALYATSTGVSLALTADDGAGAGVADMRFSDDGSSWTAWEPFAAVKTHTLAGADGPKTVYAEFRDVLGNVSAVAAQDSITLDVNAPAGSVSIDGGAAYATSANVALTMTADDGTGSGVADMRISEDGTNWSAWETYAASKTFTLTGADGAKTVYAEFRDAAGNVTSPAVQDGILLDVNSPTGTVTIDGGALYATSASVTLGLTGDDGTGSGVADMRFSEDGVSWGAWEAYGASKSFALSGADGLKSVYVGLRDAAGNISAAAIQATITLDTEAPTGTVDIDGGAVYALVPAVSLALTADDGTGTGVTDVRFSNDGTNWSAWESFAATRAYTLTGADGLKTVYAEFRDAAGNQSVTVSQDSITLDTQPPSGTITLNSGAFYTNSVSVTLGLSASDGGSGVTDMCFSEDGSNWSAWEAYAVSGAYTLTGTDGLNTVYVKFRDAVGRESAALSDGIVLDRVAPVATITRSDASPTTSPVVHYSVAFSEPVLPTFDTAGVSVTGSLTVIPTVTGTGPFTVSLFVTSINPDGLVGLNLATGITDLAGNPVTVVPAADYDIVYWPGFAGQPESADKYVGDAQSFAVAVNPGTRTLSYQWKYTDGTVQDGPASANWGVGPLTLAKAGDYWCEVACGGLVFPTSHATLQVRNKLGITKQPIGGNVTEGTTYQFSVTAGGGYAPLSYQWKKDGVNIAGAEGDSYAIAGLDLADSGDYSVEIRDANTSVMESDAAKLVVDKGVPVAGWLALAVLATGLAGAGARRAKKK